MDFWFAFTSAAEFYVYSAILLIWVIILIAVSSSFVAEVITSIVLFLLQQLVFPNVKSAHGVL